MASCPASAGRPRFEIADIVRAHRAELEAKHRLTLAEHRVLFAIELCRTAALGGHLDVCRRCGLEQPAYNSCRNRHCPKCQALSQEKWIAARSERVLPVGHFHVVFTVPSELRALSRRYPRLLFDALFSAASDTLLELGQSRFGGLLGVTMVLHTWYSGPAVSSSRARHRERRYVRFLRRLASGEHEVSLPREGDG